MLEIIFPDLRKLGRFFFTQKRKEFFYCHTCSLFQGIGRAVSFETAVAAAVAEWTVGINAHMLQSAAVHRVALMNLAVGDDGTAEVAV